MSDLFEEMSKLNIPTYAVTDAISTSKLLTAEESYGKILIHIYGLMSSCGKKWWNLLKRNL